MLSRSYQSAGYEGGDENGDAIERTIGVAFAVLILHALYYWWRFYILFLINLVEGKQYAWFKVFTCCRWELRSFVRNNMVRDVSETDAFGMKRQ